MGGAEKGFSAGQVSPDDWIRVMSGTPMGATPRSIVREGSLRGGSTSATCLGVGVRRRRLRGELVVRRVRHPLLPPRPRAATCIGVVRGRGGKRALALAVPFRMIGLWLGGSHALQPIKVQVVGRKWQVSSSYDGPAQSSSPLPVASPCVWGSRGRGGVQVLMLAASLRMKGCGLCW